MEFEKVVKDRFSVRMFQDKMVDDAIIKKILEVGRLAPTAKNLQPQKIYVVRSKNGIEKIDKVTRCRYGVPVCLLVCSNKDVAWAIGDYSSYEMDASIVATMMMLEATNLGVDNIWIRMFDRSDVALEFNLPKNIVPICIIPLGYKTDGCEPSIMHNNRKELSEFVEYI